MNTNRPLWQIAEDINADWTKPYFGAVPYLNAFTCLSSVDDVYIAETGRELIPYFLSNTRGWKGETARKIKAELKGML